MPVKYTDNSESILSKFRSGKHNALEAIGLAAEGYAKDITPVVTDNLRGSIAHKVTGNSVYIGTNVEYAPGIEFGTHRKAGAVHMLQKAATQHSEEYKKLTEEYAGNV